MPKGVALPSPNPDYEVAPSNKYFDVIRSLANFGLRPGPTVNFMSEVDFTEVERLRRRAQGTKPSYTAFVAKAIALGLRDFPYANRRIFRLPGLLWTQMRLQEFSRIDIAVACERDIPGAESVAFFDVFRDVDEISLATLTEHLHTLAESDAQNNQQWRSFSNLVTRLPAWLSSRLIRLPYCFPGMWIKYRGGSVLISSPTRLGIDAVMATQSFPLSFAFGVVKSRPIVRDGAVVPCITSFLTLNFDRRIMAGAQAARFSRESSTRSSGPRPRWHRSTPRAIRRSRIR